MELEKDGKVISVTDPKPFEKKGWKKLKGAKDGKR